MSAEVDVSLIEGSADVGDSNSGTSNRRSWERQREDRSRNLTVGPSSAREMFAWPLRVALNIVDSACDEDVEMTLRFQTHCRIGMNLYTDYSGFECARESLEVGIAGFQKLLGWEFEAPPVRFQRSSDIAAIPSKFCKAYSARFDNGEACHFGDNADRLPLFARDWIAAAKPPDDASNLEKVAAHNAIHEYVKRHRALLYPLNAMSDCAVHMTACPSHRTGYARHVHQDLLMSAAAAAALERADGDTFHSPPRKFRRGVSSMDITMEQAHAVNPLEINVAGVTCCAWSSEGASEGRAHESDITHSIWMEERRARAEQLAEDIFFLECTPRYPIEQLAAELKGTHHVFGIVDAPEFHGRVEKRRRLLAFGINKMTLEWVGPATVPQLQRDYERRFHRSAVLEGDSLFLASDEERNLEYEKMARKMKHNISIDDIKTMDAATLLELIVPPGANRRFEEWEQFRLSDRFSEMILVDLEHHPMSRGHSCGKDWPVVMRNSTIVRMGPLRTDWKIAVPMEHMAALGYHIFPQTTIDFPRTKKYEILKDFTTVELKNLSGNGMHLVTQASWMCYVLANVVRKEISPQSVSKASGQASSSRHGSEWD